MILILTVLMFATISAGQAASKSHDKAPPRKCYSAKKAIVHYRTETWNIQEMLEIARSATRYPERWAKSCAYLKWNAKRWQTRERKFQRILDSLSKPANAICHVFGQYCTQALAVARCESGPSMTPRAHNGQYLGMFQMGSYARALYGHGKTALEQARSALQYFVASGRDWSPWSCQPW